MSSKPKFKDQHAFGQSHETVSVQTSESSACWQRIECSNQSDRPLQVDFLNFIATGPAFAPSLYRSNSTCTRATHCQSYQPHRVISFVWCRHDQSCLSASALNSMMLCCSYFDLNATASSTQPLLALRLPTLVHSAFRALVTQTGHAFASTNTDLSACFLI